MRRARQTRLAGHGCQALRGHANGEPCHDAFVAKLDASGGLVYSTYLGGSRNDEATPRARRTPSSRSSAPTGARSCTPPTSGARRATPAAVSPSTAPARRTSRARPARPTSPRTVRGSDCTGRSAGRRPASRARRVRRQAAAKRPGARLWHLPRRQADRGRRRHRRGSRRQRVPRGLDAIAGLPGHPGAAAADRQPLVLDQRPARGALQRRVRDEAHRRRAAVALQHLPRRQRRGPGPRDRRRPRWAAHVAGSTDSRTLGIAAPVQATLGGGIDAHLAVIAPTGALRANAAPSTRAAASMWRVARFRRTSRSLRRCRAYLRATATCSR
jgi:hypothetical protein